MHFGYLKVLGDKAAYLQINYNLDIISYLHYKVVKFNQPRKVVSTE